MSDGPYRELTTSESGLFEKCARHSSLHTARTLQTGYFCDECTKRLVVEVFNNRAPVYHGETIEGFCGLCNLKREVTMRQWFVCQICWNVVSAYQKSFAASEALEKWWTETIRPAFGSLTLTQTEPVSLAPYARNPVTKLQGASSLSILDFQVSDSDAKPPTPIFHIEQKTGPASIEEMKEFQLDVNDFNDIVGATKKSGMPTYVFHVQARYEYSVPTRHAAICGMWWCDILTLAESYKRTAKRRGEDKRAAYYWPSAFRPIETFAEELANQGYRKLAARLLKQPIPMIS